MCKFHNFTITQKNRDVLRNEIFFKKAHEWSPENRNFVKKMLPTIQLRSYYQEDLPYCSLPAFPWRSKCRKKSDLTRRAPYLVCIHLLNTCKYCDNTRKYCGNTDEYWANTWKMWSPASAIFTSIVTILESFEAILTRFSVSIN